jgi:hypothetical protein
MTCDGGMTPSPLAASALASPMPIVLWCRVCGFFDMIEGAVCSWNGRGCVLVSVADGRRHDLRFFTSCWLFTASPNARPLSFPDAAEVERCRVWALLWLSELGDSTSCKGWKAMVAPSMLETLPLPRESLDWGGGESVNGIWPVREDGGIVTADGFLDRDPFALGSGDWLGSSF